MPDEKLTLSDQRDFWFVIVDLCVWEDERLSTIEKAVYTASRMSTRVTLFFWQDAGIIEIVRSLGEANSDLLRKSLREELSRAAEEREAESRGYDIG